MLKQLQDSILRYLKNADLLLLSLAVVIAGCGVVLIYSATRSYGTNQFIIIQGVSILLGIAGFIVVSQIDLERFPRLWLVLLVFNILFQLSLYFFGEAGSSGNRSWIRFGPIGVQPGELGKIIFIYTLACHMNMLKDRRNSPVAMAQLVMHLLVTAASVYVISHDLGVTIVYFCIFLIMLYASGVSMWWMGGIIAGGCAAAPLLWKYMGEYQQLRILVVFDPELSPRYAWHAKQSMLALGGGQLAGQGYMQGSQVQNDVLYAKHTDFIFSTCGEEFGFIGCTVLLLLLSALVLRIFYDSGQAGSTLGHLMCIGIGGMLMVQILINVGMCAGIMPVIGLTLPLLSYGGTSIVATLTALGFVCGFYMRKRPSWLQQRY